MNPTLRLKLLRIALVTIGLIFITVIYPLMVLWPSGWAWHSGPSHYPLMIVGIYATLGTFMVLAARNPLAHLSLIWFVVWSSVVHAAIMMAQSLTSSMHHGHLMGDVPVLFIVAVVFAVLTPRQATSASDAVRP